MKYTAKNANVCLFPLDRVCSFREIQKSKRMTQAKSKMALVQFLQNTRICSITNGAKSSEQMASGINHSVLSPTMIDSSSALKSTQPSSSVH